MNEEKIAAAVEVRPHPNGGFTLRIGIDAMVELLPAFESVKSYSNGPAWSGLIDYIIATDPRVADYEMDSEGRCWSATRDPLDRLRAILLEAVVDEAKITALILAGRAAGFGHGEL